MPSPSDTTMDGEDEIDDEEDRPRFCSLDPPNEVTCKGRGIRTFVEFSEACRRGQLKEIITMVEDGEIDLAGVDGQGKTPVHVAAGHRHCHEVLGYLLDKGASFNRRDDLGAVPLHDAASHRNIYGIQQLLQCGADVDVRDRRGYTPLFAACKATAYRAIIELLKGGANPALVEGEKGQTPLHLLLSSSQKAKASSKKAKCITGPAGVSLAEPVHEMIERGAPLTRADRSGLTVVDAAAACDAELLHFMLLECSLKPTDALSYAIKHGDAPAAKELLGGGGLDPCTVIDHSGNSLLHVAAAHGHTACVEVLLTGAWLQREDSVPLNVDARNTAGRTALFNAAMNAFVDVTAFLLDVGASPAIQDGSGLGVGYAFEDAVSDDQKKAICDLLQRWGCWGEEERERAESSMSAKAPGGEVVLLSGEVPFVHNFRTKHLWGDSNIPPPPDGTTSRKAVHRTGTVRHESLLNPWRGTTIETDKNFQHTTRVLEESATSMNEEAVGLGADGGTGGVERHPQQEGGANDVQDCFARERRGNSLTFEDEKHELAERDSRLASATEMSNKKPAIQKSSASGKGKTRRRGSFARRRRGHSDGSSGAQDQSEGRSRVESTATENSDEVATNGSKITRPRENATVSGPPPNQHRKLRPRAMDQQANSPKIEAAAASNGGGASAPLSAAPSVPQQTKPSRVLKTFW
ncbi:unnamed protein product [Ectocarpus fasciculatus]